MGAYSKQTNWAERLNGLADVSTEPAPERSALHKVIPRLPADQVAELIRGYQQGTSIHQLADRFGIHRGTVSRHLRRADVATRHVRGTRS
jgi:DNA-directed RNA polymerase specialized sigma24 family protein